MHGYNVQTMGGDDLDENFELAGNVTGPGRACFSFLRACVVERKILIQCYFSVSDSDEDSNGRQPCSRENELVGTLVKDNHV